MKKFIAIIPIILILVGLARSEQLDYIGYISCLSQNGTVKSKYALLENTKVISFSSSLNAVIRQLEKKYVLTQVIKGECSPSDTLEIRLTKPVMALELLNAVIKIFNFRYYIYGDIQYKPVYLLMYQDSVSLRRLLNLVADKIKGANPNLVVEWVPENRTIVLAKSGSSVLLLPRKAKGGEKGCYQEELVDYADLCEGKVCYRYSLSVDGTEVILKKFYVCKSGKREPYKTPNTCGEGVKVKTLYLDKTDLNNLLKVFEKLFNLRFVYDWGELSQLKNVSNLHLVFECLTRDKALEYLKKNFHLYLEQKAAGVYRIFADRDNYSLALREVSDLVTKVFYIQNIPLRDFIRLLDIYYRGKVVYSADPEFNAVTVIASQKTIESIVKRFGIYIRNSEFSDRLMSKIYYVKYGEVNDLVAKIKQYLSKKGIVKTLDEARAIEITDYPTNLAMIEKVFGKFLSQRPIKIKVVVKFINIEKNFARSLGINCDATYSGTSTTESLSSLTVTQNTGNISLSASFLYRKLNPLNISISAAETIGLAKTLSSPSLILLNGQQGTISQGVQIPYQSVDQNGNPTTNLVQATLTLNVEPLLLPDGRILLKLNLSNNSPNTALSVNGQPAINTFTIQQDFIVPDGGTIIIGGVLQKKIDNGETGVPILRKIPLLGWLFKTKNWSKQDSELYVIVTAKVIGD